MTKVQAKNRIEKLKQEIWHHSYLYHVLDRQEISDSAWDSLKHELKQLENQFPEFITPDSPTQRVAGRALDKFQKVKHKVRQWSFNDAFSFKELKEWEQRIDNLLNKEKINDQEIKKLRNWEIKNKNNFYKKIQSHKISLEGDIHKSRIKNSECLNYICELKIDGLHIVLTYEKGVLKTAATRGDGFTGEDVTQNVKTISSIPLRLRQAVDVVVEGEIWMAKDVLDKLNKEQEKNGQPKFANPRNAAAGSIRQLDPKIAASRKLDSFIYDIVYYKNYNKKTLYCPPITQLEELKLLQNLGFKVNKHYQFCQNLESVLAYIKKWEKFREKEKYWLDGVVIKVNQIDLQEKLGYTGKAPRFTLAYKYPSEETTTIIENIKWQIGRTGVLTPVAYLKPTDLGGSTIKHASLHNIDQIKRLDIRIGDTVIIRKAGEIIPEVVKVFLKLRPASSQKIKIPLKCPVCQTLIKIEKADDKKATGILCPNKKCFAQNKEQLVHFVSKKAFNIEGLGDKIIEQFLREGIICDQADIFSLNRQELLDLEGFAEKKADNLLSAIKKSKSIYLDRFLYALGIKHVGEETAIALSKTIETTQDQKVLKHMDRWTDGYMVNLSEADLQSIKDIGPKVAKSIYSWFNSRENKKLLTKLFKNGVRIAWSKNLGVNNYLPLQNKTFVFTGELKKLTRESARYKIQELGGNCSSSVSSKTNYLVVGENSGSKLDKAIKLNVKVIRENEFLEMINGASKQTARKIRNV